MEASDRALTGDGLTKLSCLYTLSHRARGVIRQDIFAAILIKGVPAVGVPLGMVSLVAAVMVGDMGVSLGVCGEISYGASRAPRNHQPSPYSG